MNELQTIPERSGGVMTLVRPIAQPRELIGLIDETHQLIKQYLKENDDYGIVPGTGNKPSLLKPGAEKINLAFGASAEYEIIETQVDHDREVRWTKKKKVWNNKHQGDKTFRFEMEDGVSLGLYRYVIKCRIVREGRVLATCIGTCSTLESKYIDRPRDCENTVMKMAQKRAYVGATLHAYALSERFTQDVEDVDRDVVVEVKPDAAPRHREPPRDAPIRLAVSKEFDPYNAKMAEALREQMRKMAVDKRDWAKVSLAMKGKPFNVDALKQTLRETDARKADSEQPEQVDVEFDVRQELEKEIDAFDARGGSNATFKQQINGMEYADWIKIAGVDDMKTLTARLKKLPMQ